jgi:hypothetical protein
MYYRGYSFKSYIFSDKLWLFGNFRYTHLIDKSGKCFVTDQIELNALK